jgi:predicted secreted hydrolase
MPVTSYIELPRDQYVHPGAPAEWWWHTGTLTCGDRVFGFEINATSRLEPEAYAFTQISVTDVQSQVHYQKTTLMAYDPQWAQTDHDQPWYARLGGAPGSNGAIEMQSPAGAPLTMHVAASFQETSASPPCAFDLQLTQNAEPLLVFGDGRTLVDPDGKTPLERYNYYYSLTKLQASGELRIGDETFAVQGMTWMDHEYGAFATSTKWVLQDMQLDNGVHLSNFASAVVPVENQRIPAMASILWPEGNSSFVNTFMTPLAPTWESPDGKTYCLTMRVEIPDLNADLEVASLMPAQEFSGGPVYEGVARAEGQFAGDSVSGTAWTEQKI